MHEKFCLFNSNNSFEKYKEVSSTLYGKRVDNPDISIMIPTYKRAEMLEKAIKSVLNQETKYKYELVVVDNDDSPSTKALDVVKKFDREVVSYYKNNKNIGMFGNWNRCIELAQAKWMLILHDDDELAPNFIEDMLMVGNSTNIGAVTCEFQLIDENGKLQKPDISYKLPKGKVNAITMKDFYYYCQPKIWGTIFRTEYLKEIGGFDETQFPYGDTLLLLDFCNKYGMVRKIDTLFYYRWSANESLKLSVQLENIKFNYYIRAELNRRYKFLNHKFDKWYRGSVAKRDIKSTMLSFKDEKSKKTILEFISSNKFDVSNIVFSDLVIILLKIYKIKCYIF